MRSNAIEVGNAWHMHVAHSTIDTTIFKLSHVFYTTSKEKPTFPTNKNRFEKQKKNCINCVYKEHLSC